MQTHVGRTLLSAALKLILYLVVSLDHEELGSFRTSPVKSGRQECPPHTVRSVGRAQILLQRYFEIHQLAALGSTNACEIEGRTGQRHRESRDIEEQKPRLRAVRFHRRGDKLGILYFLNGLFAESTLHFLGGKRNRIAVGAGRRTGKTARDVFLGRG